MNQIHRIVFNRSTGIAQAVPEIASSCGGGAGTSTTVGQAKRPRLNRLTTACLSALAAMATLGSVPAWADGGRGGDSVYGADALGGAAGQPSGPNAVGGRGGELFDNGGGGGGGSVNVTGAYVGYGGNGGRGGGTANGADNGGIAGSGGATPLTSGSVAIDISGPIASAGNGGDGQTANTAPDGLDGAFSGGGGGGGGGGFNFTSTADGAQLNNSASLVGGSGGRGGNGDPQLISGSVGGGGGGGEGGGGLLLAGANAVVTSSGPVTGGSGGNGGNGGNGNERAPIFASGGAGGDGGSGIAFSAAGGKLTNTGMLSGGNGGVGGAGGLGQVLTAASGAGGAGVRGADLAVINGGTISGGLSGDGATRASAVVFTGGTNSYTLLPNSVTTGNVLAFSTADTLGLSGDAVTNGNGTFDVSAIGPAAQYRGFGQFSKTGNNTWTLTGTTTAVTPWSVTGSGTLAVGSDASLGDVSGALSINGATLKATAGFTLARSLLLGNYVNIDTNGFNVTASGLIGMKPFQGIEVDPISYGELHKQGAGTLTITNAGNDYNGGTFVESGTLAVAGAGALGTYAVQVSSGATLDVSQATDSALVRFLGGAGTVAIGDKTLVVDNTASGTTFDGVIQDGGITGGTGGKLLITDAGVNWTLTNAQTFTGGTTLQAGNLFLTGNGAFVAGSALALQGGTLDVSGINASGVVLGDLSGGGNLALGAKSLTVGTANSTTYSGVASGTGGLTKVGDGTLTLAGVNTYSGGTAVNAGTVQTSTTGALGSGPVAVNAGGALLLGGNFNAGNLAIGTASRPTPNGDVNGGFLQFADNASAGTATLNNQGNIEWTGTSTAASATLTNSNGGSTVFYNSSTAGSANIVNANGQTNFFDNSSTGTATVTNQSGGLLDFYDNSTASGATVVNQAGGTVRIRGVGTPGLAIGSLSGAGAVVLGTKALTVGGLNTDTTVSGVISGTGGSLVKTGTGTLTLTGANTYTGGTTVSSGTLSGNAASFGTGAIVDNAALVIDQASDATLANTLSGTGSLTKTGTGQLLYTGNGAGFTGSTLVSGGSLSVNGSLGGTSTIGSGGVLKGIGTIGTTVLAAGATLAPGNSIGTLTVNGDFTFMPGSRYEVEVNAAGQSDLLRVNGTATLGGAAVAVIAATGSYNLTTDYTILSAANRVGTFGSVSSNFAFLDPTLRYAGNDVLLSLRRNDVAFASVGATPNQRAAAAGLQSVGASALYDVVVQSTAATAQSAFNQLSGELHASVKTALLEDSRFVRDAALDRLRSESGNGMSVNEVGNGSATWARVFGSDGHIDGDGNAWRLNRDLAGFLVGADTLLANGWRTGALAGYSKSNLDVDGLSSTAKADSYHVGVYGGTQWDATSLRLGASYTWNKLDTQRNIGFTGFANNLKADYDVSTTQIFGEIGQRIDMGTVAVEPFAGLAYVNVDADGFRETGGAAALRSGGGSIDSTFGTLGVRASTQLSETTRLRGTLGWRHAFGERVPTSTNAFATGNAFTVSGVPLAKDVAVLEAGIETQLQKNMTLGLSYAGQFGDGLKDHGFKVSLGWKF